MMEQYGIHKVTIPLPFWNSDVHCYLAKSKGKWKLVDTGMNRPETRKSWENAFLEHGIDPQHDVEGILLTHHHPDHLGYAGILQEWTGAAVYLSEEERHLLQHQWTEQSFAAFYRGAGMPLEVVQELQKNETAFHPVPPPPHPIQTLREGDLIDFGELTFRVLYTPGHTAGHVCFYNEDQKVLVTGDHLTRETMPYISYHGFGDKNPLGTYIASLEKMRSLDISLVLPGHGPLFADAQERITEILNYYQKRIERVREWAKKGGTAFEVSHQLFPEQREGLDQWIAIGEANAYLHYLVEAGELKAETQGGLFRYKVL
ncbi:MBL fold metallo-hydrolase [Ammoniphilus sp. 3BR4]|uniref:MBL fold metallo-hydrolase n=1 Tax=Ammoniphilus sp. 3BR4 TaxID=3158265 RepID=UPI003467CF3A